MKNQTKISILLLSILVISTILSAVSFAQNEGAIQELGKTLGISKGGIWKFLTSNVKIPAIKEGQKFPFIFIVGVFTLLFSIIFVLSERLPFFKQGRYERDKRGPIIAFSVALSLILIFSTKLILYIYELVNLAAEVGYVILIIFFFYAIFLISKRGIAKGVEYGAETFKIGSEATKKTRGIYGELKKGMAEEAFKRRATAREETMVKGLEEDTESIKKNNAELIDKLGALRGILPKIEGILRSGRLEEGKKEAEYVADMVAKYIMLTKRDTSSLKKAMVLVKKIMGYTLKEERITNIERKIELIVGKQEKILEFERKRLNGIINSEKVSEKAKETARRNLENLERKVEEIEKMKQNAIANLRRDFRLKQQELADLKSQVGDLKNIETLENQLKKVLDELYRNLRTATDNSIAEATKNVMEAIGILEREKELIGPLEELNRKIMELVAYEFKEETYTQGLESKEAGVTKGESKNV